MIKGNDSARTGEETERRLPWETVLIWYMRVVSALWIAKGLVSWLTILGEQVIGPPFDSLPLSGRAAVIAFAVLDPVAGVGLWLTSAWGGVMWLLAVVAYLLVIVATETAPVPMPLLMAVQIGLVCTYLALSWLAARES